MEDSGLLGGVLDESSCLHQCRDVLLYRDSC